ncbi:MAG TPA: hypothetical protein VKF32_06235 [Thermoanaerobaculia bacterium]|nr:hypothetical protein [Thermoanaerobaculia bacterium]
MTAHRLLAGLGGPLLFLCAGYGVLAILGVPWRIRGARRAALAYLAGVAGVSMALWVLSHVLWVPLRRASILSVILSFALIGAVDAVRRLRPAAARALHSTRSLAASAAFVFAAIVCAGCLADALTRPILDWDGQMTWDPAARWVRSERTVDAKVMSEARWYVTHPQYPLLLPLAQVAVEEVFDTEEDGRVVRPLYSLFLPAYLVLLYFGARRLGATRPGAALMSAAAAAIPILTYHLAGGAVTTYGDFPLAAFWGAAVLLLLEARRTLARAAGFFLGAGLLTKNEGLPLALIALAVFAWPAVRRVARLLRRSRRLDLQPLRPAARTAVPVLLCAALLFSWRAEIPNRWDEVYTLAPLSELPAKLVKRIPPAIPAIGAEMLDKESWRDFWWVALVAFLAGARTGRTRRLRPAALALAGCVVLYLLAYATTPWLGNALVHPTWNRFVVQLSIPLFAILATRLDPSGRLTASR